MTTGDSPVGDDAVKAAAAVMVTRGSVREILEAALPFLLRCGQPVGTDATRGDGTSGHCGEPVDHPVLLCDHHAMPGGILPNVTLDPDRVLELRQQLALMVRKFGGVVVLPPREDADIPEFFASGELPDGSLVLTTDEETVSGSMPVDPPQ